MTKSPNRLLAVIFGVLYVLVGILGFTATAGVGLFDTNGGLLLGIFEVNVLHNVVHLLVGAALLIAGLSNTVAAKVVNLGAGALFLLLGLAGLFVAGTPANVLALNGGDNVLHLATAVVLLAVALGAERDVKIPFLPRTS